MTLYQALLNAGSQTDQEARKHGEAELMEQKKQPGFVSGLMDIFSSDAAFEARWLAAIQLKNSIDGLWRAQMIPEEKEAVRSRLLQVARVGDDRLQRQFAMAVAKVAKIDFPRHWPTLFEDLIKEVQSAQSSEDLKVPLVLLHQCLKLIATAKIGNARTRLNEVAAPLLELLGRTYNTLLSSGDLTVSYTCLKAMGTLLYAGPDNIYRQGEFFDLVAVLEQMLPVFVQTSKHVLRIGKIYERIADRKPVVFAKLPGAIKLLELYRNLITQGFQEPKAIIQGATIFRALLELALKDVRTLSPHMLPLKLRFKDPQDKQDLSDAYEMTMEYFLREGVLLSIVEVALSKYFVLGSEELELWRDDPEEFIQEELMATHEFNLTVCFQLLYNKILKSFPALSEQVMQFIQSVFESPQDLLRLDAAMQALEYGSAVFSEKMQLMQLFEQLLMLINQNQNTPNYNVVRRRTCLLIGEWLILQGTEEIRALVYRVVVELMFSDSPLNDLPVQLAALQLLKSAVDDFEFESDSFMPYADATFGKIYDLLNNKVQSLNIRRSILDKLCTLVEQCGRQLGSEHIMRILSILPPLWNEPSENQLIKTVIVQTLMHLVDSCRAQSAMCHPFALEVLSASADLKSPLHSYLIEDALGLWQSLLTNADQPYPAISQLFPVLVELLVGSTENISIQLTILASYIHLEPSLLNGQVVLQLLSLFAGYFADANVEAVILMLQAVELMAKMLPASHWQSALVASGMVKVLEEFGGGDTQESMILEVRGTKVFGVLSWMAIQDPMLVVQTFNFPQLSDGWVRSIKSLGDPHDRKLHTLGLTLCAQTSPDVLREQAPMFIDMWTMVLDEVKEVNGDAPIYHTYPGETDDDLTPEQLRLRALAPRDPVHQMDLRSTINGAGGAIGWTA